MQELTRLKHSVSLLETYILANHRPGAPLPSHLKHSLENPVVPSPPKKEPIETDILEKDNVPGMLGSHGHGGFYTGATSAVTHLTLVLAFPFSLSPPNPPPPRTRGSPTIATANQAKTATLTKS